MAISPELKNRLMREFGRRENDTGSPHVQIAVLTHEIQNLTGHLKTHTKDHSSRRGLLAMVSRRRRLLDYLKTRTPEDYITIIAQLGIRK
jgi:small subunit ribosomal protein S15